MANKGPEAKQVKRNITSDSIKIPAPDSTSYWVNQKYLECINTGTSVCKCGEENSLLIIDIDTLVRKVTIIPSIQYSWETFTSEIKLTKPGVYLMSPEYGVDTNSVLSVKGNTATIKSQKHTTVFTKVKVKRRNDYAEFDMRTQIGIMNCLPLLKYKISAGQGSRVLLTREELEAYISKGQATISCSDDYYYSELSVRATNTEYFVVYEKSRITLYKENEVRGRGDKVDISKLKEYQVYLK